MDFTQWLTNRTSTGGRILEREMRNLRHPFGKREKKNGGEGGGRELALLKESARNRSGPMEKGGKEIRGRGGGRASSRSESKSIRRLLRFGKIGGEIPVIRLLGMKFPVEKGKVTVGAARRTFPRGGFGVRCIA